MTVALSENGAGAVSRHGRTRSPANGTCVIELSRDGERLFRSRNRIILH